MQETSSMFLLLPLTHLTLPIELSSCSVVGLGYKSQETYDRRGMMQETSSMFLLPLTHLALPTELIMCCHSMRTWQLKKLTLQPNE